MAVVQNASTSCWGKARLCPTEDAATRGLACQAWYRCEGVADYVIRWRCHADEDELARQGLGSKFRLCNNSNVGLEGGECPPPVVCPSTVTPGGETVQTQLVTDMTTDVILAVVLGVFALLALTMMVVSTYKYWKIRKRLRLRSYPKTKSRTFPHALRHYTWWGLNSFPYDRKRIIGKAGNCQGIPYTDVYIPQELGHESSFQHQHLVTSDISRDEDLMFYDARKSRGPGHMTADRRHGDPSVITGSFVYQPSAMVRETSPHSDHTSSGSPGHFPVKHHGLRSMVQPDESTSSFWHKKPPHNQDVHVQQASLSEFYFQAQNAADPNAKSRFRQPTNNEILTDFTRRSHISSIPIPTYDELEEPEFQQENPYFQPLSLASPNKMLYNNTKTGKSGKDSKPKHRFSVPGRLHVQGTHVSDSMSSAHHNQHYSMPAANNTFRTSPDLISSHNFSSHVHKAAKMSGQKTNANVTNDPNDVTVDYDASHDISAASVHRNGSMSDISNNSSDSGRKFIAAKHERRVSSELSYDSFRNEHLRDMARQGPASSSTLDTGFRYLMASDFSSSALQSNQ